MTRIYLVRHGETDWNATQRCQGTMDIPLNARGTAQAEALATALRGVDFDAAYTSPLDRARRTADAILSARHIRAMVVPELREMSYGAWQGLTPDEWPGDARQRWIDDPWHMLFPDGESLDMVRRRVRPAVARIVNSHPGDTVLISCHGHANRVILIGAGYCAPELFWEIAQPNGFAWILDYDNDGHARASRIAQLSPEAAGLPPSTPTTGLAS